MKNCYFYRKLRSAICFKSLIMDLHYFNTRKIEQNLLLYTFSKKAKGMK